MWVSRNPVTFNEKIQFKAAHDRRELLTVFADKIQVRDHISATVGSEYLPKIYVVIYDPESIDWTEIPEEFVFKVNHGSGGIVVVSKSADRNQWIPKNLDSEGWTTYNIHPDSLVRDDLVQLGKHWLTLDYSWHEGCGRMPEWAYKNIKRGMLFEELLVDINGGSPADYKFHMFNGKCVFLNVVNRNFAEKSGEERKTFSNVMTPQWEKVDLILNGNLPLKLSPKRPNDFEKMLSTAEKLASGMDYVRVDMYNTGNRILVGELTNYPAAGQNTYEPKYFDFKLGQILRLDNYKADKKLFKLMRELNST